MLSRRTYPNRISSQKTSLHPSSLARAWRGVAERLALAGALGLLLLTSASTAEAASTIKRAGAHARYGFELEPHLVYQYARFPAEGPGFGVRFNVPLFHNGPIPKLNNNMAIGFGVDTVFWNRRRRDFFCNELDPNDDCDGVTAWFPVVLQWNFYLTEVISVFAEPGIAARFWRVDGDSDFDPVQAVFGTGARFQFGKTVGLTLRIGTPSVSVGANFLF